MLLLNRSQYINRLQDQRTIKDRRPQITFKALNKSETTYHTRPHPTVRNQIKKQGRPYAIYRQKPAVKLDSQQDHKAVVPRCRGSRGRFLASTKEKRREQILYPPWGPPQGGCLPNL